MRLACLLTGSSLRLVLGALISLGGVQVPGIDEAGKQKMYFSITTFLDEMEEESEEESSEEEED